MASSSTSASTTTPNHLSILSLQPDNAKFIDLSERLLHTPRKTQERAFNKALEESFREVEKLKSYTSNLRSTQTSDVRSFEDACTRIHDKRHKACKDYELRKTEMGSILQLVPGLRANLTNKIAEIDEWTQVRSEEHAPGLQVTVDLALVKNAERRELLARLETLYYHATQQYTKEYSVENAKTFAGQYTTYLRGLLN